MWAEGTPEPLVSLSRNIVLQPNENEKTVTLLETRPELNNNPPLTLTVRATNDGRARASDPPYAWSLELEVTGGGIVESDDHFLALAPEAGYEPAFNLNANPTTSSWSSRIRDRRLYFATADRTIYGSLKLDVNARPTREVLIYFKEILINPNSSRNLEYDPSQRIKF